MRLAGFSAGTSASAEGFSASPVGWELVSWGVTESVRWEMGDGKGES